VYIVRRACCIDVPSYQEWKHTSRCPAMCSKASPAQMRCVLHTISSQSSAPTKVARILKVQNTFSLCFFFSASTSTIASANNIAVPQSNPYISSSKPARVRTGIMVLTMLGREGRERADWSGCERSHRRTYGATNSIFPAMRVSAFGIAFQG
jgi:hypothetical protein